MKHPAGLPSALADLDRTLVWGVLNVTPDSFSDGGEWLGTDAAVSHGLGMVADGADVIDVGGESTRPGAPRISVDEELSRVIPVIEALTQAGAVVSVDTMRGDIANAAVSAGAAIINDVSGGLADPAMLPTVAGLSVPFVIMHWRGHSANMDELATYNDVVSEVAGELEQRVDAAVSAGVARERLVIDPGLGFAKQIRHNWPLLARAEALNELDLPLLIGASRKRFLGAVLADSSGAPRDVLDRDVATHAVSAIAAMERVWAVRVHDVRGSVDAVRVASAWLAAREVDTDV
jgi:dihydropteroate synthase